MNAPTSRLLLLGLAATLLLATLGVGLATGHINSVHFGDASNCGPVTNGHSHRDVYWMGGGPDCTNTYEEGDEIHGEGGSDGTLNGSFHDDFIYGNFEGDGINGGAGNDVLNGNDGNDQVVGEYGPDNLGGGEGPDYLDARDGLGWDQVDGGPGDDTCVLDAGDLTSSC